MNKHFALLFLVSLTFLFTHAQNIAEVKGIRLYEHHSTNMTGQGFGSGANGSQSGYDFVNRTYFNSFNETTFGPFTNGEEANIDMVEHNGPFGTNGQSYYLGFTSGVSTIWGGDIKGNNTTKWHKVVDNGLTKYEGLQNYTDLKSHFGPTAATVDIAEVKKDDVFIGQIRNTDLYVMIKCTNVAILRGAPNGGDDNVYFDFDYKFGTENGVTGIKENSLQSLQVFPNPVQHQLTVKFETTLSSNPQITLYDVTGKQIDFPTTNINIQQHTIELNTSYLPRGLYRILLRDNKSNYTGSFLKTE